MIFQLLNYHQSLDTVVYVVQIQFGPLFQIIAPLLARTRETQNLRRIRRQSSGINSDNRTESGSFFPQP